MRAIKFSPRGYMGSVWRDVRAASARVARDRAALAAIILILLPWWTLVWVRQNLDWLQSLGEIVVVVLLFWWMSRSGSVPAPEVKRPMLESIFAIVLVIAWVGWRTGICTNAFPFLPPHFNCFGSLEFELIPKLIDCVVIPFVVLFFAGYRWRALGVNWSWRAWWISLPVLLATLAYGFYLHQQHPLDFVTRIGQFFAAAGLPEEFLFRALLLTRLEAWWRSPGWALFGAATIFGLTHLPIDYLVFTPHNWNETLITAFTFQMGFGVAFAFAYQRTRNIWPLALIHAMVDALYF